jgi:hypothetical protein
VGASKSTNTIDLAIVMPERDTEVEYEDWTTEVVRALANRDYLGDWFARTTYEGYSPFACTVLKTLPWYTARLKGAVSLRAI